MFSLFRLLEVFREGSARRSAVQTLGSLSAAQLRDLGIPSDGLDEFVGDMLAASNRREKAVAAARSLPAAAAIRNTAAAEPLQVCG
jgi:hypothetical protein